MYDFTVSLSSVGDQAAEWISDALRWNQTLSEVNLKGNLVGDDGIIVK